MIIVVADLHLGSQLANKLAFNQFIHKFLEPNRDDISRIVLLGDILDLWRNTNSQVLLQNLDVFVELGKLDLKKNYLVGNHDYAIFNLLGQSSTTIPPDSIGVLDQVSETLELNFDGLGLKFIHGHQVDYWPSLRFYEIFSQAMCFVDDNVEELSDVWTIVSKFSETLPDSTQNKLRNLSRDTQIALEQKLAGPLDENLEKEKTSLCYEWELLTHVRDFNDLSKRSGKPLEIIEHFAEVWRDVLETLDRYRTFPLPPPHVERKVYDARRSAADLSVGLGEDQFLIRGHGHIPYVNLECRIADAGCWLGTKASFLKVEDGKVSVHRWPE